MKINHEFAGDHDFFTVKGAPARSNGWVDGWRVEIDGKTEEVTEFEFFDAEANKLFPCSMVPGSDLHDEISTLLVEQGMEWFVNTSDYHVWQ